MSNEVTVATHTTVVEKKVIVPVVHLNGTSRDALVSQANAAVMALDIALGALQLAAPHARDYYPLGNGAYTRAEAEHRSRYERVSSARDELMAIGEALLS